MSTAMGFSAKTCLPASMHLRSIRGAVSGRGRHQHDIDVGLCEALEGIQAGEPTLLIDLDALLAEGSAESLELAVDLFGEGVGHGPELDLVVRLERLGGCARPATTATNQANLDRIAAPDFGSADVREAGHRCGRAGCGGGLQEFAAGGIGGVTHVFGHLIVCVLR